MTRDQQLAAELAHAFAQHLPAELVSPAVQAALKHAKAVEAHPDITLPTAEAVAGIAQVLPPPWGTAVVWAAVIGPALHKWWSTRPLTIDAPSVSVAGIPVVD